jgi:hypothetical protein
MEKQQQATLEDAQLSNENTGKLDKTDANYLEAEIVEITA